MINTIHLTSRKSQFIIVALCYTILASMFGYAVRYGTDPQSGFVANPDIISYLRLAGYIAEGNFQQSITGWWGPMISWLLAPFLYFGVDGIIAARIVVALSGLGLVISSWLLAKRLNLSDDVRLIVSLIASLLISRWTVNNEIDLTPDLLLAALIVLYFYLATTPDLLINKKAALLCGVVAGLAYLSKHYALPFFMVHFPATLVLMGYAHKDKKEIAIKRIMLQWGMGMLAFILIAGPWIMVISSKYHRFTIATAGKANHAIMGPDHKLQVAFGHMSFHGLHKPKETYMLYSWEDPSEMEYKEWSPFENRNNFIHQLKIIENNILTILKYLFYGSPFFSYTFLVAIFTLIPLALLLNPLTNEKKFLYGWTLITLCIYASGYVLTFAGIRLKSLGPSLSNGSRYFYPMMIVMLLIAFHFFEELKKGFHNINKQIATETRNMVCTLLLLIVFMSAFTIKPGLHLFHTVRHLVTVKSENVSRNIAEQLRAVEFPAPYAVMGFYRNVAFDLVVAYYLEKQYLGGVISTDIEGVTKELRDAEARSLIVYDNLPAVQKMKSDSRYIHKATLEKNESKYINKETNIFILR